MAIQAVFLDRDGVINKERGYITQWEDFEFLPGAFEAIRLLKASNFLIFIVTNQSSVAKGLLTIEGLFDIHSKMLQELENQHAGVDAVYFCPHHEEGIVEDYSIECNCRKPKNGLIEHAIRQWNLSTKDSFIIGDSERDIQAGAKSGLYTIGVETGHGFAHSKHQPDYIANDILAAAQHILSLS